MSLNGRPRGLIAHFRELPDGAFGARLEELRELGIDPKGAEPGFVLLGEIEGVTYDYDERAQTIDLHVPMDARARAEHALDDETRGSGETDAPGFGFFANYRVSAHSGDMLDDGAFGSGFVVGSVDAKAYTPWGHVAQGYIVDWDRATGPSTVRLDSSATWSDPKTMLEARAGDMVSGGGLSWTRPVRLGGLQLARRFELRPDLVTRPLPDISSSAAVPSTADIYIDGARRGSLPVDDGPFLIRDLPVPVGAGQARIVLRDATGSTTVTDLPLYAPSELLREGLTDFSLQAGYPRFGFGERSFDYSNSLFGSFQARHGLTDTLTLEASVEAGEELFNAGAGSAFRLGSHGEASLAAAASGSEPGRGALLQGELRLDLDDVSFFARSSATFGRYEDIASSSASERDDVEHADLRPARWRHQLGLSFAVPATGARAAVSFASRKKVGRERETLLSASVSNTFLERVAVHLGARADLARRSGWSVFLGMSVPFGEGGSASSSIDVDRDGATAFASASRSAGREPGSHGWRIQGVQGARTRVAAEGAYRGRLAEAKAGVAWSGEGAILSSAIIGAVGVAEGTPFASNQVAEAIAVVDAGAPGVPVFHENRPVGATGANGRLVVPHARAHDVNRISIDPAALPGAAVASIAEATATPPAASAVLVDFGVEVAPSAMFVRFVTPSGEPAPFGAAGRLLPAGPTFLVGHDGEAYLGAPGDGDAVEIRLPGGETCRTQADRIATETDQYGRRRAECVIQ